MCDHGDIEKLHVIWKNSIIEFISHDSTRSSIVP